MHRWATLHRLGQPDNFLAISALGATVARTWRLDAARVELVCSVQVVATSPAAPAGNPTLLEA
jgi:hypothetical protein